MEIHWINLSRGQKQRIQIARALYQDVNIYLFDDPFSVVDAHTGTLLFNKCILDLLSSKTVLYITHQMEFLPAADLILVMKDGKVSQAGKYNDILKSGSHFMELVGAHREALSVLDSIENGSSTTTTIRTEKEEKKDIQSEPQKQLVEEEQREKGKVGFSVYWKFLTTAYGGALVPVVLLELRAVTEILELALAKRCLSLEKSLHHPGNPLQYPSLWSFVLNV